MSNILTAMSKLSKIRITLSSAWVLFVVAATAQHHVLVSVKRSYEIPKTETLTIVLSGAELTKNIPSLTRKNIKVIDAHFYTPASITIEGSENKIDQVVLRAELRSDEPVYTFRVSADGPTPAPITNEKATSDPRIEVQYLRPYNPRKSKLAVAEQIASSTLHTYPNQKDLSVISPGKWTYEYGFFLNGVFKLYEKTGKKEYLDYVKGWVDNFITEDGKFKDGVYNRAEYRLDDILPGRLCISLFKKTGDKKYKAIANVLMDHLAHQPRTSEGGYWHKEIYPYQMWLDGIYMGDIFSMQYAAAFKQPEWFDESVKQIKLMYKHAYDPATGLMFHGWDESKNKVWANQTTGASPELWSRAIGWYAMALIDCLDYLPANHPERKNIELMFQKLCTSIAKFQDRKTGLWFQIINKGDRGDNWIETSASGMFIYAFAKGNHKGLLDKSFLEVSSQAYDALLNNYVYADLKNELHLDQAVKVGSLNIKNSKGDYDYYINCERRVDDYKGLAALLYASMELNR